MRAADFRLKIGLPGAVLACALLAAVQPPAIAAEGRLTDKTTTPQAPVEPRQPVLDCRDRYHDPRCRPARPDPRYDPYYRRPVILNTTPPEPEIDTDSVGTDWEGCRSVKLGAIRARSGGNTDRANHLDEWLWKNCRGYSEELRALEQDRM